MSVFSKFVKRVGFIGASKFRKINTKKLFYFGKSSILLPKKKTYYISKCYLRLENLLDGNSQCF